MSLSHAWSGALTGSGKVGQALREAAAAAAGEGPADDVFDEALWTALDALEREAGE